MSMPNRKWQSSAGGSYRFSFNGKEDDTEWGVQDYGMRIYDKSIAKFLSVDPLTASYPWLTPYQFASNTPIQAIDLNGLEAFFIHGTSMSSSEYMFDDKTTDEFKRISGNKVVDKQFSWGTLAGLTNKRDNERTRAAAQLAIHVIKTREQLLKEGKIQKDEPITLIGYSHGGNIAIQAADEIYCATGVRVQIVTYATPAYNDGSSEDPKTKESISYHIHLYSGGDGVDYIAGGDNTYNNCNSVNYEISQEAIKHTGAIDTHTDMGDRNKNTRLADFLRTMVGKIKDLPTEKRFFNSNEEEKNKQKEIKKEKKSKTKK